MMFQENPTEIESILLAVVHIKTYRPDGTSTNATGFYFTRNDTLFLITNRHVVLDEPSGHVPTRIEIGLHPDPTNLAVTSRYSISLYDANGNRTWREAHDTSGSVDVVSIPILREYFPNDVLYRSFTPAHLPVEMRDIEVGHSVRVVGFPLGFHDTLHNLPVMRHAIVASSFSLRFQGNGYFLTDSLLHRGSSGSPVVAYRKEIGNGRVGFPWYLLGVHSARLSAASRDPQQDERLNLFAAWYADVLLTLTN
ncbi:trypsin-like peptidase domain-containing protein [Granulosicoccaceae sp. 1_MG-2023]|nr:trypsin-like peptidase domain-containing protein [Granulosicoccaceae sp. 1_MG-2023]